MQSISVFMDTTTFAGFWWKNGDGSRTEEVYQVIYIFS